MEDKTILKLIETPNKPKLHFNHWVLLKVTEERKPDLPWYLTSDRIIEEPRIKYCRGFLNSDYLEHRFLNALNNKAVFNTQQKIKDEDELIVFFSSSESLKNEISFTYCYSSHTKQLKSKRYNLRRVGCRFICTSKELFGAFENISSIIPEPNEEMKLSLN